MNVTRTIGLLSAALATTLVAACGSSAAPPAASGGPTAGTVSAEHNEADIAFVQGMIPHHTQAVEMAELATDRASSPQVKELATTIGQAQQPEIEQMRAFLEAWGVDEEAGSTGGMNHGGGMGAGMPGMMTGGQMRQLEDATGAAFDRMFLQMMTEHHTGAVQMARTELSEGENPQAKALAQKIIDDQTREIEQMRQLLTTV